MIANLRGKIFEKESTKIIIDVNGVGYEVFTSTNTTSKLGELNDDVSLHIVTIVREDAFLLYGFESKDEKSLFNMLISINKIGPKIAMGILSAITPQELQAIVLSGNSHALSKLPGIGAKTAPKIILELKDKIGKLNIEHEMTSSSIMINEAISALVSLGYSNILSQKSVIKATEEFTDKAVNIEDLIRKSLKNATK